MNEKSSDQERCAALIDAAEQAILVAPASDIDAVDAANARAIVTGVMRVYGFEADGTRRAAAWQRRRGVRLRGDLPMRSRATPPAEGLRATFDGGDHGHNSDDEDDLL